MDNKLYTQDDTEHHFIPSMVQELTTFLTKMPLYTHAYVYIYIMLVKQVLIFFIKHYMGHFALLYHHYDTGTQMILKVPNIQESVILYHTYTRQLQIMPNVIPNISEKSHHTKHTREHHGITT